MKKIRYFIPLAICTVFLYLSSALNANLNSTKDGQDSKLPENLIDTNALAEGILDFFSNTDNNESPPKIDSSTNASQSESTKKDDDDDDDGISITEAIEGIKVISQIIASVKKDYGKDKDNEKDTSSKSSNTYSFQTFDELSSTLEPGNIKGQDVISDDKNSNDSLINEKVDNNLNFDLFENTTPSFISSENEDIIEHMKSPSFRTLLYHGIKSVLKDEQWKKKFIGEYETLFNDESQNENKIITQNETEDLGDASLLNEKVVITDEILVPDIILESDEEASEELDASDINVLNRQIQMKKIEPLLKKLITKALQGNERACKFIIRLNPHGDDDKEYTKVIEEGQEVEKNEKVEDDTKKNVEEPIDKKKIKHRDVLIKKVFDILQRVNQPKGNDSFIESSTTITVDSDKEKKKTEVKLNKESDEKQDGSIKIKSVSNLNDRESIKITKAETSRSVKTKVVLLEIAKIGKDLLDSELTNEKFAVENKFDNAFEKNYVDVDLQSEILMPNDSMNECSDAVLEEKEECKRQKIQNTPQINFLEKSKRSHDSNEQKTQKKQVPATKFQSDADKKKKNILGGSDKKNKRRTDDKNVMPSETMLSFHEEKSKEHEENKEKETEEETEKEKEKEKKKKRKKEEKEKKEDQDEKKKKEEKKKKKEKKEDQDEEKKKKKKKDADDDTETKEKEEEADDDDDKETKKKEEEADDDDDKGTKKKEEEAGDDDDKETKKKEEEAGDDDDKETKKKEEEADDDDDKEKKNESVVTSGDKKNVDTQLTDNNNNNNKANKKGNRLIEHQINTIANYRKIYDLNLYNCAYINDWDFSRAYVEEQGTLVKLSGYVFQNILNSDAMPTSNVNDWKLKGACEFDKYVCGALNFMPNIYDKGERVIYEDRVYEALIVTEKSPGDDNSAWIDKTNDCENK